MSAVSIETLNAKIILFSVIGIGLSIYAFIVENKIEHDSNYEAMCDISEHMSCTKAFSSEYGKGLGLFPTDSIFYVPNSVFGVINYILIIFLSMNNTVTITTILLLQIILSNVSSVYFAYILYFILSDFCVVCVSIYIVNAALLMYTFAKYSIIKNLKQKQTKIK